VQVDPIKPTMKPPGNKHLKLKYDELLPILLSICFQSRYPEERIAALVATMEEADDRGAGGRVGVMVWERIFTPC